MEKARQQALKRWSQPVCELHFTILDRLPMPLHNVECSPVDHCTSCTVLVVLVSVSISMFISAGVQHSMTAASKSTVSLVLDARDLRCAAGRTSRNEAGPVDLYAEASAAAWQSQDQPPAAQSSGPQLHTGTRPGASHTDAPQTQPGPVSGAEQLNVIISSAQPAVSARLGSTVSHQTLLRPSHPNTPFTPPDQLQQQQQLANHSSRLHNRTLNSYGVNSTPSRVTPGAVTTAARVQSASQAVHQSHLPLQPASQLGPPRTSR